MLEFMNRKIRDENKTLKAVQKNSEELQAAYAIELKKENDRLDYKYDAEISRLRAVIIELEETISKLRKRDKDRKQIREDMEVAKDILIKTNKTLFSNFTRFYREIENKITMAENLEIEDNKIKEA